VIPLGPLPYQAGAAADAFDVAMATIVLGAIALALAVNVGAAATWIRNRFR
jgi:hypothetical protein